MNEESHITNRIVLRSNPILCICLACIHLTSIGNSISLFKHRGATISEALLDLGRNIVDEMNKDNIETIFMDTDFKSRTVLHLITYNKFAPLMSDGKVTVLLDKLWQGKLTY
jgi:hypothetical protein